MKLVNHLIPLFAAAALGFAQDANADPVYWSVNGHYYEFVAATEISWSEAEQAAEDAGGYLVTLTSEAENEFVRSVILASSPDTGCWRTNAVWGGGYQDVQTADGSTDGWRWVTGEAWSYTNWSVYEPNDYNCIEESLLAINWLGSFWNDESGATYIKGYVIEYGSTCVPDGGATAVLLGVGLVGLVAMRRRSA